MSRSCTAIVLLVLAAAAPGPGRADYALHASDTVVFLGDSITAARTYGKVVENYTLLRYPGRKVRFVNAGRGGDTAAGGLPRLDADVVAPKPPGVALAPRGDDLGLGPQGRDRAQK